MRLPRTPPAASAVTAPSAPKAPKAHQAQPQGEAVTSAGPLDEDQAKTLLGALGVPTPPRRPCRDRAEAHQALTELPGPVAVKILDAVRHFGLLRSAFVARAGAIPVGVSG